MKFQFRGCTSLLLTITFLIMSYSGIILYFSPRGGSSGWTKWFAFNTSKPGWEAIHVNICLLFLIVALIHLIFNWTIFWSYIKRVISLGFSMKTELLIAILLAGIVTAGTIYNLPPFSIIRASEGHRGPPDGRGPGFAPGFGEGGRMEGRGQGQGNGQGRQFRGGRGPGNTD